MLQVFLNVFHFGMDIQDAIDAPRITSHNFPSSFAPFGYYPVVVSLEGRIDVSVRQELTKRGHRLDTYPDYTRNSAAVEMIVAEPKPGFIRAGADPRQPAYAIVR
jgi:gamma-glutamyltranspeptidase / glutathione hydrolase